MTGPRLDLWRAPTDNDHGLHGEEALEPLWRRVGLHRLQHRVDQVSLEGEELVVRGRVAVSGKHTLALTNRVSATTADLLALAREVRDGVRAAFGVELVPEPVLVGCIL